MHCIFHYLEGAQLRAAVAFDKNVDVRMQSKAFLSQRPDKLRPQARAIQGGERGRSSLQGERFAEAYSPLQNSFDA